MLPGGAREWCVPAIGYLVVQRRWKIFTLVALIAAVFDQASKFWARSGLAETGHKTVIANFFDFQLSYNTGAAFSMFDGGGITGRILLTAVAFLALGFIAWMVHKAENRFTHTIVALGLIAGGAIGNVIDRVAQGRVTDFILWRYYDYRWPIFNIADAVLLVGVAMLLLSRETWQSDADDSSAASSSDQVTTPNG